MSIIMTPGQRKLSLVAHIATSVGLLGAVASFLVLALIGLQAFDPLLIRGAYASMGLLARIVILPLAIAALLTGVIQAWGTHWGLLRHYWVIAKLLLTAFATAVLLAKMPLVAMAAELAKEPVLHLPALREAGLQLAVHAVGGLLVLLVPTVLSVYKPKGRAAHGRNEPSSTDGAVRRRTAAAGIASSSRGGITITLRRNQVVGFVGAIFVLHFVVLHLLGFGHFGH